MPQAFTKTYGNRTYRHVTMVRHKGTIVALAMDSDRRIFYSVLDLQDAVRHLLDALADGVPVHGPLLGQRLKD